MKIKAFTIKVPKKLVKGRIETNTRHGSYAHTEKTKYKRSRDKNPEGGE